MTIIVGYKKDGKVFIGGDTQGSSGWDKTYRKDKKVFISHGIAYGFTSSYRMGQILMYHSAEVLCNSRDENIHKYVVTCLVPMWREILKNNGYIKNDSGREESGQFLIGIDGRLFSIHSDMQVAESSFDYDAVGCGRTYALGAIMACKSISGDSISAEDIIDTAIKSANSFSNGCGGDVSIVSV